MNWIISCNTNDYDIFKAFEECKAIFWHKQRALSKSEIGDIVYIYCGKPYGKIMFKCKITNFLLKDEVPKDDEKYWKNGNKIRSYEEYMELQLLDKFDKKELSLDTLQEKGFDYNPQWPRGYKDTEEIIKYIEVHLQIKDLLEIKNEEDIQSFWRDLRTYLEKKTNFSQIMKMEKSNQNWVDIKLLPTKENKEAHIVLRISKRKFRIEYYINNNKSYFNYLLYRKNEIELENNYTWDICSNYKCSKVYKEIEFSEINSLTEAYIWYWKEIISIYNIFPYYLTEFIARGVKEEDLEEINREVYLEGRKKERIIIQSERNPLARKKCIELKGTTCQVCGMNFEEKYGELGKDYIEVHHIKPISEIDSEYVVDLEKDLIPVCSNCHSMLHRKIEGVSVDVEKLIEIVNKKGVK